jgi:hypothetical protein
LRNYGICLVARAAITDPGYRCTDLPWIHLVHLRKRNLNGRMLRSSFLSLAAILTGSAIASVASVCLGGEAPAKQRSQANGPVDQLIPWLLDEGRQLRGIPFAEVILDATGKRVLPVNTKDEIDLRVIKQISAACDETIKRFNMPDSAIQNVARINDVSSHFEDSLRELLNAAPGLKCDFPRTAEGRVQRSGYPDLRIVDVVSKRVFYLDPKLYVAGAETAVFAHSISNPKWLRIKSATTPCIWSSDSNINHRRKMAHGNSRAGSWSISPSSKCNSKLNFRGATARCTGRRRLLHQVGAIDLKRLLRSRA